MTLEQVVRRMRGTVPGLRISFDDGDAAGEWRPPSVKRPCQGCGKKQVREVAEAHPGDPEFVAELRERGYGGA